MNIDQFTGDIKELINKGWINKVNMSHVTKEFKKKYKESDNKNGKLLTSSQTKEKLQKPVRGLSVTQPLFSKAIPQGVPRHSYSLGNYEERGVFKKQKEQVQPEVVYNTPGWPTPPYILQPLSSQETERPL